MLKWLGNIIRAKLLNISGDEINPASDTKLDELKSILQDIDDNTDELELTADNINLNAENINLNTDELESKVQSIRDQLNVLLSTRASENTLIEVLNSLGEESGTDILTELKNVVDKLDVNLSILAKETTLQAISGYLNTVESKLQTIIDTLDISLSTRASESTVQEIRDAIGQESGSTVLSKLQDLWDKLVELFETGIGKIKIWDGTYQANVTDANRLQVESVQKSGSTNIIQIKDGRGNEYYANVDDTGRLLVASNVIAPPETTPISETRSGNVSGTDDYFYTIPNGEILHLTRFSAGGEVESTAGTVIELYYAPNGNTTGLVLIDAIFASGNSDQHDLSVSHTGDGTRAILIRRRRLSGGAKEVFARIEGYY